MVWGEGAKDKGEPVRVDKAFPAIVSKTRFRKVNRQMRSRAPRKVHPRRVGSSYLLSGLVKCRSCSRAMSGQDSKGGKFAYYVCQSLMKRGSGACDCPRLNARRFEEMVVGKIRENVLTESNIRELVKLVDEEMDGIAREQRQRLETADAELEDVRRRLDRLYNLAETTDLDIEDFKPRIKDHRERQEKLEATVEEARAMLSQRRVVLDDVETITAYCEDLSKYLNESELTERRAFIESFVKEIVVQPGGALVRYTIPISQSTSKIAVLMGGRFGCDRVKVRRTDNWGATSALMIGSNSLRWGETGSDDMRRQPVGITGASTAGDSFYSGYSRQGAVIVPRCLFFVNETENTAIVQAAPTVTVNPRRGTQDKAPWKDLDLTTITGQTVEESHLFSVHLGETIAPYVALDPLKALLPLKRDDSAIPTASDGPGGVRMGGLERRMWDRWQTIDAMWETNKAPANQLSLLGQLDYLHKLSSQLDWQQDQGTRDTLNKFAAMWHS